MTTHKQTFVDVVVPFPHILVVVLHAQDGLFCGAVDSVFRVCSTLDVAKQTLARHKGSGAREAWGIDNGALMVLWAKTLGWRRCPVRHLKQVETEWTP